VVKEFSFQKAYRKDIEYLSYYTYDLLLRELARRLNISVKQGHYLLIKEITSILRGKKKININELNKRIECNFYLVIKGKIKFLVGGKAKEFIKKIKTQPVPQNIKELNGQCACKGKAKGIVKIIKNKEDYPKFKNGDILVSWATNPNMVPLMKKSSAIITDEGGVTCHAAIVSRELGIPCVIGTRFATKVLHDNQLVEVDANKGIVKIIK
jgi:phosphohistidine swiveling domain-containing protein